MTQICPTCLFPYSHAATECKACGGALIQFPSRGPETTPIEQHQATRGYVTQQALPYEIRAEQSPPTGLNLESNTKRLSYDLVTRENISSVAAASRNEKNREAPHAIFVSEPWWVGRKRIIVTAAAALMFTAMSLAIGFSALRPSKPVSIVELNDDDQNPRQRTDVPMQLPAEAAPSVPNPRISNQSPMGPDAVESGKTATHTHKQYGNASTTSDTGQSTDLADQVPPRTVSGTQQTPAQNTGANQESLHRAPALQSHGHNEEKIGDGPSRVTTTDAVESTLRPPDRSVEPLRSTVPVSMRPGIDGKYLLLTVTGRLSDPASTGSVHVTASSPESPVNISRVAGNLPGRPCSISLVPGDNLAEYSFRESPGPANNWGRAVVRIRARDSKRPVRFTLNWRLH